jgi:hypothetical protein
MVVDEQAAKVACLWPVYSMNCRDWNIKSSPANNLPAVQDKSVLFARSSLRSNLEEEKPDGRFIRNFYHSNTFKTISPCQKSIISTRKT